MEEEKILNVTQLQVVDKIQAEDVILLIRDTGNGKQCFQIKGSDFRGESAYEAALKQGFVGTYQDWTQHIKEITKYKPKPKIQYIIGKAMPIGKLDGGARLNAYFVSYGNFRFKLSNVPQLGQFIRTGDPNKVDELLEGVTWHVFIDDREVYTDLGITVYNGGVMYIYIKNHGGFYKLDESKSSVDLSSDMYIYLITVPLFGIQNCTSKTLFYHKDRRIWKPAFELPYIYIDGHNDNWLKNSHSGYIQIQRLHTVQTRSRLSGLDESFSVRRYRGKLGGHYINYYGIYRYRLVKNGKKTQWRTISIMNNIDTNGRWDLFSIK